MWNRILSVVLIAAIVACPWWCATGACHAGSCCAAPPSASQDTPTPTRSCCQASSDCPTSTGPTSAGPTSDREGRESTPPQDSQPCQGICGGAVLEKSVEIDDSLNCSFGNIANDVSLQTCCVEIGTQFDDSEFVSFGRGNYGRFVRTLQMSFLC